MCERDYLRWKSKLGFQDIWCKIPWVPPLKYLKNVVSRDFWFETLDLSWSRVSPSPWNLARLRDFGFELVQIIPPPLKMKIWPGVLTLDLSWSRVHPQDKFGQIEGLWIWVGPQNPRKGLIWELVCGDQSLYPRLVTLMWFNTEEINKTKQIKSNLLECRWPGFQVKDIESSHVEKSKRYLVFLSWCPHFKN